MPSTLHRYVQTISLGVLALGLAGLVVAVTPRNGIAFKNTNPFGKSEDSKAILQVASLQYVRKKQISPGTSAAARRIAAQQPLAGAPFSVVAVEAIQRNQIDRAIKLLEAARLRNPRDRFARSILLEQYAQTGAYSKAADELTSLYRLIPSIGNAVVDTMTQMALDPEGFAALKKAVHGEQVLAPLLANMVRTGAPLENIVELAQGMPPTTDPAAMEWRKLLLQRLIAEGRYTYARALWAKYSRLPARYQAQPFYNFELARSSALAPFNWDVADENIGAVDLLPRGIASISYFGRESGPLMRQLLTLSPGTYRFRYAVEGSRDGESDALAWRIRCAVPGKARDIGAVLMQSTIREKSAAKRAFANEFVVSAACPAQWLSLDGISAEFPTTRTLEISGLSVIPKGR